MLRGKYLVRHSIRTKSTGFSPITFTPTANQARHIFEEEKLTPEENYAAVPDKPDFSSISKAHYRIINPEDVADLVTKLNTNDVLVSSLSRSRTLYGDTSYRIKSLNTKSEINELEPKAEPTIFPYASILFGWKKVYNQQIKPLQDLEPVQKTEKPRLDSKFHKLFTDSHHHKFEEFFIDTRAFRNSDLNSNGGTSLLELREAFTVEDASNVVLDCIGDSKSSFLEFLNFIIPNIGYFRIEGLKHFLSRVSKLSIELNAGAAELKTLVEAIDAQHKKVISILDSRTLNNIALAVTELDPKLSARMMKYMIDDSVCPSEMAVEKFIKSLGSLSRDQTLRELTFLKPVLFHRQPGSNFFAAVLHTITNINEVNKLVIFLKRYPGLLAQEQTSIYKKIEELGACTSLYISQFLKVLKTSDIKLSNDLFQAIASKYDNSPRIVAALSQLI
ncbi:hypothetical protein KGF56_002018 [Candida oxycetoniae]|uniref:ATPase expression protein 1 n=1 Tax=Candida oxycetoniae TaxID=497107 RepID=A0AAI9SXZ8_9ASCO|nr:uncharacterized protein KGF56_002018 [Candida oxycetoniae]KAI3405180.2 hypothetical protein KGF56_002018 [Candida oxycetoniae]